MSRRPSESLRCAIFIAACAASGCGGDEPPGFHDCEEWRRPGFVRLEGTLRLDYTGWVGSQGGNQSSPSEDFKPYGAHGVDDGDGKPFTDIYGCALDAEGNLWRLRTFWQVPSGVEAPIPVSLDDEPRPDGAPQALFSGDAAMCVDADCVDSRSVFFTRATSIDPDLGEGTVTRFGSEENATLAATVGLDLSNGIDTHRLRINVDATWPHGAGGAGGAP
jgi:hypothetical protein